MAAAWWSTEFVSGCTIILIGGLNEKGRVKGEKEEGALSSAEWSKFNDFSLPFNMPATRPPYKLEGGGGRGEGHYWKRRRRRKKGEGV